MARKNPNGIRGRIRALDIGEYCDFPLQDRDSVKSAATAEAYKLRRKFRQTTLSELGLFRITRVDDPQYPTLS